MTGERGPRSHVIMIILESLLLVGLLVVAAVASSGFTVWGWLLGGFMLLSTALSLAWQIRCLVILRAPER